MKNLTIIQVITVLFTLFTAMVVFYADTGRTLMVVRINHIPMLDKIIHMGFCFSLTLLINLATGSKIIRWSNKNWLIVSILLFGIFTVEECSQIFLARRNFEVLDLLANYTGIILGSKAVFYLNRRMLQLK